MQRFALFIAITTTTLFACVLPKMPFTTGGSSHTTETQTVATSETHTVNGHPVDSHGNREDADDDDDAPKHKANHKPHSAGGAVGATCRENSECESNTCYVGSGEIGYCTEICDSFADCPKFWDCTHEGVGNAPQKICQQKVDD
jgi:hypothetical protein